MYELPSWKLPDGISRTLWDSITNNYLAETYDEALAGLPLLHHDEETARRFFEKPGRLIDLGCGTGRLLTALSGMNHELVGVDLSWAMLKVARRKLQEADLSATLIRSNFVELDAIRESSFDYAACLFSTLGMMGRSEHRMRAVEHVFRILKPGGRFLLHVHNRWWHLGTRAGQRWLVRDLWSQLFRSDQAGNFVPPATALHAPMLHHFSLNEVRRLLLGTGFRIEFVESISQRYDCRLPVPWLLPGLRAYGFLLGAARPE